MPGTSGAPEQAPVSDERPEDEQVSVAHSMLMNCVVRWNPSRISLRRSYWSTNCCRVIKQLGCPHGCAESQRGPPADFLRSQGQSILSKLHRASHKLFTRFFRRLVQEHPIAELLEFFHAYTGYCVDPGSLLSPLSELEELHKKSHSILIFKLMILVNFQWIAINK